MTTWIVVLLMVGAREYAAVAFEVQAVDKAACMAKAERTLHELGVEPRVRGKFTCVPK
jgi:hypothetical protein